MQTQTTWRRYLRLMPVLLLALALVAAACGGDDDEGKETDGEAEEPEAELFVDPAAPVLNVDLGEFFVTPEADETAAGDITIAVANTGAIPHELVIVKTDLAADDLPLVDGRVDEHGVGVEMIGEIEEFDAGLTVSGTFDMAPGNYVFFCNIPGHYVGGMTTEFTVE